MDFTEIDGRLFALEQQRNDALNRVVILSGQVKLLEKKIEDLNNQINSSDESKPETA